MNKENINRYRKLGLSESDAIAMAKLDKFHEEQEFKKMLERHLPEVLRKLIRTNSEGIIDIITGIKEIK